MTGTAQDQRRHLAPSPSPHHEQVGVDAPHVVDEHVRWIAVEIDLPHRDTAAFEHGTDFLPNRSALHLRELTDVGQGDSVCGDRRIRRVEHVDDVQFRAASPASSSARRTTRSLSGERSTPATTITGGTMSGPATPSSRNRARGRSAVDDHFASHLQSHLLASDLEVQWPALVDPVALPIVAQIDSDLTVPESQ